MGGGGLPSAIHLLDWNDSKCMPSVIGGLHALQPVDGMSAGDDTPKPRILLQTKSVQSARRSWQQSEHSSTPSNYNHNDTVVENSSRVTRTLIIVLMNIDNTQNKILILQIKIILSKMMLVLIKIKYAK